MITLMVPPKHIPASFACSTFWLKCSTALDGSAIVGVNIEFQSTTRAQLYHMGSVLLREWKEQTFLAKQRESSMWTLFPYTAFYTFPISIVSASFATLGKLWLRLLARAMTTEETITPLISKKLKKRNIDDVKTGFDWKMMTATNTTILKLWHHWKHAWFCIRRP